MLPSRVTLIIGILVVFGAIFYSLTQENTPTPTATPFPTLATDPFPLPFPDDLFCSDIVSGPGPTWEGITIGESTLAELQSLTRALSENYTFKDLGPNGVILSLPSRKEALEKTIPSGLRACIEDGIVIALNVNFAEETPSHFLDDWIAELGIPDAVTWDNASFTREVFWFEEGIAASVLVVEPYGAIEFPIYFPYQPAEGYENRWPFSRTRHSQPQSDVHPPPPSEQNPFDFDAIVATMTAEPSRTPTPTFTPRPTQTAIPTPIPGTTPTACKK